MVKWTSEQLSAINKSGNNLLISASAGSGKTATIIEKVIKLVKEGACLERIVMLTYTNAAAQEMKEKLIKALSELAYTLDKDKKQHIINELDNINYSDISTIHSFCKKIIKKYFNIVDIDPSFTILSEEENTKYLKKAVDNTIKHYLDAQDYNFNYLYEQLFNNRSDKKLKDTVLKINAYLDAQIDTELYIKGIFKHYSTDYRGSYIEELIVDSYKNSFLGDREQLIEYRLRSREDEKVVGIIDQMLAVCDVVCLKDLYLIRAGLVDTQFNALSTKILDTQFKEELQSYKANFKKKVDNYKDFLLNLDELIDNANTTKPMAEKLFEIVLKFREELATLKSREKALYFSDLEHYTIKILKEDEIANKLADSYDYIFVDEYQDTNYVQEYILNRISRNNLNMVGDVKQSIYKFRLTEPEIFVNKYKEYLNLKDGEALNLNCNFRSYREILNFVNIVFSDIMTNDCGGVNYKEEALFTEGLKLEVDSAIPAVSLKLLDKDRYKTEKTSIDTLPLYSVKQDSGEDMALKDLLINDEAMCIAKIKIGRAHV